MFCKPPTFDQRATKLSFFAHVCHARHRYEALFPTASNRAADRWRQKMRASKTEEQIKRLQAAD